MHIFRVKLGSQGSRRGQHSPQDLNLAIHHAFRELNVKLNDEVTELRRLLPHGHTLPCNALLVTRLDHLTCSATDNQLTAVKVGNHKLEPTEGLGEGDLLLHVEVVLVTDEAVVLHLLDHEDNIPRDVDVGVLVALSTERDLVLVLHALLDEGLQGGADLLGALAGAVTAAVVGLNLVALTVAGIARDLHLLHHGAHLSDDDTGTRTAAHTALRIGIRVLGAAASASWAQDSLVTGDLHGLAVVKVLECDGEGVTDIAALAATGTALAAHTTSAEEGTHHVIHGICMHELHCF